MRLHRFRFELRMKLAPQVPGMVAKLANLHVDSVRSLASNAEAVLRQNRLVFAIEFVAVTMTLADLESSVGGARETPFGQIARVGSQAHGAAQFVHALQLAQLIDDAIRGGGIDLGCVGLFQSANIASELDHHGLHAEADSKIG